MRLHVLTAVTRPENLSAVAHTLARATATVADIEVVWHWRFDPGRQHVGGQHLKNEMLDRIHDGWVWILDDDTVAHPALVQMLMRCVREMPDMQALVVSQARADGRTLRAAPENVRVGFIDAGQALLRRDLIGEERLPETYEGDGQLLERLLPAARVVYCDETLSLYNAIRPVSRAQDTPAA